MGSNSLVDLANVSILSEDVNFEDDRLDDPTAKTSVWYPDYW
jgi:hypothetical protein